MFLFWKNIAKYEQLKIYEQLNIFLSISWNEILNAECPGPNRVKLIWLKKMFLIATHIADTGQYIHQRSIQIMTVAKDITKSVIIIMISDRVV